MVVSGKTEALEGSPRGPGYYYIKFGGRIVVGLLVLLYFFKSNVVEYFDVSHVHKGKALGILVAVTALIFAMTFGFSRLSS